MARQKGPIKIIGTIDDLTFVRTRDGYIVKEKTSLTGDRIKNDPGFVRTRENGQEFGNAGKAATLLQTAFRTAILGAADFRMIGRLVKVMVRVGKSDQVHARGLRTVAAGDLQLLQSFEFNGDAALARTIYTAYTPSIDRVTGAVKVVIPSYEPKTMIVAPQGTSHYRLVVAGAEVDFDANFHLSAKAVSGFLQYDDVATAPLTLTASVTPNSTLPLFLTFGIEFYQLVNTVKYPLNNGAFNAFAIKQIDA